MHKVLLVSLDREDSQDREEIHTLAILPQVVQQMVTLGGTLIPVDYTFIITMAIQFSGYKSQLEDLKDILVH